MTAVATINQSNVNDEYVFSDKDFRQIADLANTRYGLHLQPSKKALVHSRLTKRLRALGLPSFEAYCALLDRAEGDSEQVHLLSALTTNVTHFFREMHHFDYLKEQLAPNLIRRAKAGENVRLWSSACSAGQEAYCIAAVLLSVAPDAAQHNIKILATDIDSKVVGQARIARYPVDQLSVIPAEWQKTLLSSTSPSAEIEINPNVQKLVTFGELNLIDKWPMKGKFDVIFCRNAAIYFDKSTQSQLWQRFAEILHPGGHLMIGHSERLNGPAQNILKNVAITTYQRRANDDAPTDQIMEGTA